MRLRRQLAVLAVSVAFVAVAGCSADVQGRGDPTLGTPGAPSASGVAPSSSTGAALPDSSAAPQLSLGPVPTGRAGGNATQVCADVTKATEKGTAAYVQQLTAVLQAQGKNDKPGEQAAEKRLGAVMATWALDLRRASATATDQQLKTTLSQMAGQIAKMTSNVATIDDAALGAIQDRLETLCPTS
ncbi:hypothetical protein Ais01nite_67470 [Asanoa ishikariensis]|uniref:Lipoprotein n=1 Tax=Asanoa ishikariensis TaxID=137265 RepID=A0A1H3NCE6_9ACTN|nr:hypothetical protein [Asanoa ishikariensis]GIF68712.1 hypothetical protein Ais01nite_67470 [Asanoa ishikariensis]SDY86542.1 hypothetical protein SAMN05421684_1980 [Asanoa ishikariensis]